MSEGDVTLLTQIGNQLQVLSEQLLALAGRRLPADVPLWEDIRADLPRNLSPEAPARGHWWVRDAAQIDGITLHHTMTNNLEATAQYCTRPRAQGGKGYPTTQYAFWVAADGQVFYCVDVTEGMWHDHCGDKNTHISIGMAGRLDIAPPPDAQLQATARLVAHLMRTYGILVERVAGHNDWALRCAGIQTICPGWDVAGWRNAFYAALENLVKTEVDDEG